jgi:hypothetical protein
VKTTPPREPVAGNGLQSEGSAIDVMPMEALLTGPEDVA